MAEPEMVSPVRVVVPKPDPATVRNLVALDDEATSKTGLPWLTDAWTATVA